MPAQQSCRAGLKGQKKGRECRHVRCKQKERNIQPALSQWQPRHWLNLQPQKAKSNRECISCGARVSGQERTSTGFFISFSFILMTFNMLSRSNWEFRVQEAIGIRQISTFWETKGFQSSKINLGRVVTTPAHLAGGSHQGEDTMNCRESQVHLRIT
jgi:polyferredoxin